MPEFIADSGDGGHPAELFGDYITDAPNKTLFLDSDDYADTGFTLPNDVEWYTTLVNNVEGDPEALGLHVYSDDLANFSADIEALRQEAISEYSVFSILTIHYKTGGLADIYHGDEATAQSLGCTLNITAGEVWLIVSDLSGYSCEEYDQTLLYDVTNIATEFIT